MNFDSEIKNVAFITNISFPKSLDDLLYFIQEEERFAVETVLFEKELVWTSPKWAKSGCYVFFKHSKTSISTITALKQSICRQKIIIQKKNKKI